MSNITNNSPVVTEQKLTEFYNDIKPFLGCPAYVTQEGDEMYFSFNEKVVGRWTNNKPLYQKTVIFSPAVDVSSTSWTNTPISRGDIEFIINIDGWYDSGTGFQSRPLMAFVDSGSSVVKLLSGRDGVTQDTISGVIFQYTKTTDSAATTIEQKPTHYSTDEQVVGTWVDGKPIYQKTVVGVAPTTTTDGTLANGEAIAISEVCDQVVKVEMTIENNADPIGTGQQMIMTNSQYFVKVNCERGTYPKFGVRPVNNCTRFNGLNLYITVQYTKTTD